MLANAIRETDIWGWYKQDSIGGIIFTEFNGTARQIILSALSEKIDSVLRRAFDPEERKHVQLSFHFFPEPWTGSGDASTHNPAFYPDLEERNKSARFSRSFKRAIDLVGSLLLLILLSPLLAAIAIAIKLDSQGPVLFKQDRVGQYGTRFTFLKFRSMVVECDPNIHKEYIQRFIAGESGVQQADTKGRGVFKLARDSRVTRFGRWLRKTSLDELPQLLNVLRGEMSLVGPRPPIPYELESYYVWHTRRILETKPGITGLWQVRGRSRTTFDDMVRMDLQYARTWSLWLDLRILLQTPHAVIFGRGAY
ncbi:MAG: sugar transferase [Candidatus Acidiferrales bacterium]